MAFHRRQQEFDPKVVLDVRVRESGEGAAALSQQARNLTLQMSGSDLAATRQAEDESSRAAIAMALLERHFMADELPPSPLLAAVERIAHLPCHIVHGRFDMVCPADQAQALAGVWPRARLEIVDAAGHWTFDPRIAAALGPAAQRLRAEIDADAQ